MKSRYFLTVMAAGAVLLAGCEWETSDSETDSWNDLLTWANFSGLYRAKDGKYLVRQFGLVDDTTSDRQVIGSGTGVDLTFGGDLSYQPIVRGSVSVQALTWSGIVGDPSKTETFRDSGSGALTGSLGGTGSINYNTGVINVTFNANVVNGSAVVVNYEFYTAGSGGNVQPGSSSGDVFSFMVTQTGNKVTLVDNNGRSFNGRVSAMRTTGGDSTGTKSGHVIAHFNAYGALANGRKVTITGTFTGNYAFSTETQAGSLGDRELHATWVEESGRTGDINGAAAGTYNVVVPIPTATPTITPVRPPVVTRL